MVSLDDFETEVGLKLQYSEPALLFLDQTDLSDRVGEVFEQQVSAVATGAITEREAGVVVNVNAIDTTVPATSVIYTIKEAIQSLTIQGKTYTDIVVVDYLSDQPNPQTGQLTPVTTTYYLARGIGLIRSLNATTLYGTELNWELESTNLVQ